MPIDAFVRVARAVGIAIALPLSSLGSFRANAAELIPEFLPAVPPPGFPPPALFASANNSSNGANRAAFTSRNNPISRCTRGSIARRSESSVCNKI